MINLKKILSILILSLFVCSSANSQMKHSISKDEFKGTTSHYIMTDSVEPNRPLSFPYQDTRSNLVVGCKENNYYWAYVYFNSVNLTDGNIGDGYYSYTLEVKAGESFHKVMATQDFGDKFISFDMLSSDKETITKLMRLYNEIWIQFNHFQDGNRFYKYNTKGFSELFDTNCKNAK